MRFLLARFSAKLEKDRNRHFFMMANGRHIAILMNVLCMAGVGISFTVPSGNRIPTVARFRKNPTKKCEISTLFVPLQGMRGKVLGMSEGVTAGAASMPSHSEKVEAANHQAARFQVFNNSSDLQAVASIDMLKTIH